MTQIFNDSLIETEQKIDGVVLFTDWEPDDIFALLQFAVALKRCAERKLPILFCVGEGDWDKDALTANIANMLNIECKIVQSSKSNKKYPSGIIKAFETQRKGNQEIIASEDVVSVVENFLKNLSHPLLLVIKPFASDLLKVDSQLLRKSVAAFYGSFNFAETQQTAPKVDLAQWINNSFQQVVVFETFLAMGEKNNISPQNAKQLYDLLDEMSKTGPYEEFVVGLFLAIKAWNTSIVSKCKQKLAEITDKIENTSLSLQERETLNNDLKRSKKIVENIEKDIQQMVFADSGLMSCILASGKEAVQTGRVTRGNLRFEKRYTKVEPNPDGKVLVIEGLDKQALINSCEASLK